MMGYAAQAVARGWHTFPVAPGGKTPMPGVKWGQAANNLMPVTLAWWTRWPNANIGIACKPSGLLVVDCDKPKSGTTDPTDGVDRLIALYADIGGNTVELFDTYSVRTGSGGLHLYYRWPEGVPASQSPLAPLVDIRGSGGEHGGYVLAAGSVTDKGPYTVEYDRTVANCPPTLVQLIREKARKPPPVPRAATRPATTPGGERHGGLVRIVADSPEGNRNAALHWAACCMRDDGAPVETAITTLGPPAEQAGLAYREIEATVRSAYRNQR